MTLILTTTNVPEAMLKRLTELVGAPVTLQLEQTPTPYREDYTLNAEIDHPWKAIAWFSITKFPGNSSTWIFHDVATRHEFQGRGIGQALLDIRTHFVRMCRAEMILCTVAESNSMEKHILKKNGFQKLHKTDAAGQVWLWYKHLF